MERYFGSFLKETYRRDSTWNYYEMIGSFCLVLNMLGLFYALMVSFSSNHQPNLRRHLNLDEVHVDKSSALQGALVKVADELQDTREVMVTLTMTESGAAMWINYG